MKTLLLFATFMILLAPSAFAGNEPGESHKAFHIVDFKTKGSFCAGANHSVGGELNYARFKQTNRAANEVRVTLLNFKTGMPAHKEFAFLYWDLRVSFKLCKNLLLVLKYN